MAPRRTSRRHTITKSTRAGSAARETGTSTGTDTGTRYSPGSGAGAGAGPGSATGARTGARQTARPPRVRSPGNIGGDKPSARKVGDVHKNGVHTKTSNREGSEQLDWEPPTDNIVDMDMDVDMNMNVDIDVDVDVKPVLSPSPSPPAFLPLVDLTSRSVRLSSPTQQLPLQRRPYGNQSQSILQPKLEPLSPAPQSAPTSSAELTHPLPHPTLPAQLSPPAPPAPPAQPNPLTRPIPPPAPAQPRFAPRTSDGSRQCTNCGELDTPQWRGTLCNASREHQKKEHSTYPSSGAKAFQDVHPRRRHRRRRRLNLVITPLSYITIILHTPTPLTPTRDPTPESTPTGKPAITRGQGQGQGRGDPCFQATATAYDTPSKDEFMRVAGWLWGVLDRTERILRAMDAMEERNGLASDLEMGAVTGQGTDVDVTANTSTSTSASTGTGM
ncbi:hypothetical protein JCM24511_01316 [Saitozyma sp. JCM 24511]|nr:hypothetical protein JCM24511_01316 [Saitozyma sp. JCM 24511]